MERDKKIKKETAENRTEIFTDKKREKNRVRQGTYVMKNDHVLYFSMF
jgi:hypothetical protein